MTRQAPTIGHGRPEYAHEPAYRECLGLAAPRRFDKARVRRLHVLDEFALNPDKIGRRHTIREGIQPKRSPGQRVFMRRGATGTKRSLVNEALLADVFAREGYVVLDMGDSSFESVRDACGGADVIVSVEGSHLAHALFLMRRGGVIVILNPPHRVATTVADIGIFMCLSSGMFVCEPDGDDRTAFRADADELRRFIDAATTVGRHDIETLNSYVDEVLARRCRT